MFKQRSNNLLYSQWSIPKSYPTFFFFMIQKLFHMDMSQWGKEKTIKIFLFNSNFRVIIMLISVLLIRIRKSFIAGAVLLEDNVHCAENPE